MKSAKNRKIANCNYSRFKDISGDHPLQKDVPDSCVTYKARKRKSGKVAYFNFRLAREMGLIDNDHPTQINRELSDAILETFSIIIVNEYDQINGTKFNQKDLLPHKYIATRYLQLQHPNKQGKTSGDGRSIWNGSITNRGKTWDISSCGTGATCLSPATSINNKYYKSGDPSISYGCGYSEIDEGYNSLFFSEVFKKNGIETEQVLAIIRFPNGISVNIRAHHNLLRPSHFFRYVKLSDVENLKKLVNYYIDREIKNKTWKDVPRTEQARYRYFLQKITETFAKVTANFEDDYIFCWLDWDGDNILMDGGIIDYGSVRQFGLFHHNYRFDDDDRFSTTITEQKKNAKYIIQTFSQAIDFLITKDKKCISTFKNDKYQSSFDNIFELQKNSNILKKIGFNQTQQEHLLTHHLKMVKKFRKTFSYFERAKTKSGPAKLPDGITWSAIFCMRDILRELPQIYLCSEEVIPEQDFIEIIKSSYASKKDLVISQYRHTKIELFQKQYWELINNLVSKNVTINSILLEITMRSSIINKYYRVTGDSIGNIVFTILKQSPRLTPEEIEDLLHFIVDKQHFDPDQVSTIIRHKENKNKKIKKRVLTLVKDFREGI